jgi:alkyldihydroxyacetonephosphate synthase
VEVAGTDRRRSFWGWGNDDSHLSPPALGRLAGSVSQRLGAELKVRRTPRLEEIELRRPRVTPPQALEGVVTEDLFERCLHSYGRSFRDVVRSSKGEFPNPPDAVAFPRDAGDVERLLDWCSSLRLAAIPFGGGSSVVGGVEPDVGESFGGVITIDLAGLGSVKEVDTVSRAALIQAGALGPAIEEQLKPVGLTLRHFPQSFEFSTLGGWIATRSGGHFATRETRIDDVVEALTVVTPAGMVETRRVPSSGAGPGPERLFLGSEGVLGVVTEAWVRLHERPSHRSRATVTFEDAETALEAVRALAQSGLDPANCRLLDPSEALDGGAGDGQQFVLLVGFESSDHPMTAWLGRAIEICRDHSGLVSEQNTVGEQGSKARGRWGRGGDTGQPQAADAWRQSFAAAPYLRDALVLCGAVCETFETAVTWDRFEALHAAVMRATKEAIGEVAHGAGVVSWRLTHVYPDGAAPYYTVVAAGTPGSELSQWETIKEAATEAILANGGTTTHHHGIGRDHRGWWERERAPLYGQALHAARRVLDPAGICNPGALLRYGGGGPGGDRAGRAVAGAANATRSDQ